MQNSLQTLETRLLNAHSDLARLDALLELAEYLVRRDNHRSLELTNEAQALALPLADQNQDVAASRLARSLMLAGAARYNLVEYQMAKQNLTAAIEHYKVLEDNSAQARCLNLLGLIAMEEGRSASALEHYLSALALSQTTANVSRQGACLMNIGIIYKRLGDYDAAALDYYLQALHVVETNNDLVEKDKELAVIAPVSINIGDTLGRLERWEESLVYCERALQFSRQIGDKRTESSALLNTGEIYYRLHRYERAYALLEAALKLFEQLGDRRNETNALRALGQVCSALNQETKARQRYESGLQLARSCSLPQEETQLLIALGQHLLKFDQTEEPLAVLQTALELSKRLKLPAETAEAHLLLVTLYKKQNQFDVALAHYERFHTLREQLYGEKQDQRVELLIVQHEVEKTRSIAAAQSALNLQLQAANKQLEQSHAQLEQALAANRLLLEQVQHQASHDALTNLPNRSLFTDRLEQAVAYATRYDEQFAVMMIDLNGFKQINDRLGHKAGDDLLIEIAKRLRGCMRESDTAARVGGDEFVVVMRQIKGAADARRAAEKLLAVISMPLRLSSEEASVGASIGISLYPDNGLETEELQRRADAAMYEVKRAGKSGVRCYDSNYK